MPRLIKFLFALAGFKMFRIPIQLKSENKRALSSSNLMGEILQTQV